MHFKQSFYNFLSIERFVRIQNANRFLNRLSNLPLIKRVISSQIYRHYHFKNNVSILLQIFRFLWQFILNILTMGIFIGIHNVVMMLFNWQFSMDLLFSLPAGNEWGRVAYWWLLLSGWASIYGVLDRATYSDDVRHYVNYFNVDATPLIRSYDFITHLFSFLKILLPLWLISLFAGQRLLMLLFVSSYLASYLLEQWLRRHFLHYTYSTGRSVLVWLLGYLTSLVIGLSLYMLPIADLLSVKVVLPLIMIASIIGMISWYKWQNFPQESAYITKLMLSKFQLDAEIAEAMALITNPDMVAATEMSKNMQLTKGERFEHLKGQSYLNALLFDRYHQTLMLSQKRRVIGFMIGGLLVIIALFVGRMTNSASDADTTQLFKLITGMALFFYYAMSMGKTMISLCFINCDVVMLNYPFYRQKKEILAGFNNRLKRILFYNSWIGLVIIITLILMNIAIKWFIPTNQLLALLLIVAIVTVFLSFNDLFLYYLLQPFANDMSIQSTLYRTLNSIFYFLVLKMDEIMKNLNATGLAILAVFVLLYLLVGYIAIIFLAPKTFKLRR